MRRCDPGLHRQPPEHLPIGTVNGRHLGLDLAGRRPSVLKLSSLAGGAESLGRSLAKALPRVVVTPKF